MDVPVDEIFTTRSAPARRLYRLAGLDPLQTLTPTTRAYRAALQACLTLLRERTLEVQRAEATAAYWRGQATERRS